MSISVTNVSKNIPSNDTFREVNPIIFLEHELSINKIFKYINSSLGYLSLCKILYIIKENKTIDVKFNLSVFNDYKKYDPKNFIEESSEKQMMLELKYRSLIKRDNNLLLNDLDINETLVLIMQGKYDIYNGKFADQEFKIEATKLQFTWVFKVFVKNI